MTRKLKTFCVLLAAGSMLAAFTTSAGAEVSSAAEFTTSVIVEAEQVGGTANQIKIANQPVITCTSVTAAVRGLAEGSSEALTLDPTFSTCHIIFLGITKQVTFTINGCAFVIEPTTTETKGVKSFVGDTEVECPPEKQIEIHIYNNVSHTELLCTYDLKVQSNLKGVTLTNKEAGTPDDVDADFNVSGIAMQNTTVGGICGGEANPTATYTGTQTIRSTSEILDVRVGG